MLKTEAASAIQMPRLVSKPITVRRWLGLVDTDCSTSGYNKQLDPRFAHDGSETVERSEVRLSGRKDRPSRKKRRGSRGI